MKKLKRFGILALITLMLAMPLASCGDGGEETTAAKKDNNETTVESDSTQDMRYVAELPDDLDFGGREIEFLGAKKVSVADEFFSESGSTGDPVTDAVYARNLAIEDKLNVKLNVTLSDTVVTDVDKAISSDKSYDMFGNQNNETIGFVLKGYCRDLSGIEHLDLSKKYWTEGYNGLATIGMADQQYLITGAPAITIFRYMYATIFNIDYFESVSWESLYDLVEDGTWTLDKQAEMISDVNTDLDGKTGIGMEDFVGFTSGDIVSIDPYLVASEIEIVKKDDMGEWYWDSSTLERTSMMVEKVQNLFYNTNGAYIFKGPTMDDTGLTFVAKKFAEELAAMATVQIYAIEATKGDLGSMNYGIVPMPKLNEDQEEYYTYIQDQVTTFGILSYCADEDLPIMGAFLECMACESYKSVMPAYYEKTLSYKLLKDEKSLAMLNTMYETIKFDFVGAYGANGVRDSFRTIVSGNTSIVASKYASWSKMMPKWLDSQFNDKIGDLV